MMDAKKSWEKKRDEIIMEALKTICMEQGRDLDGDTVVYNGSRYYVNVLGGCYRYIGKEDS